MTGKIDAVAVGEVLWDIFPDSRKLGGAPFNFALHLKRLGADCRFVSRVGRDPEGDEIRARLLEEGFAVDTLQVDDERRTGSVSVALDRRGVPDFTIHDDAAFDRIAAGPRERALLAAGPGLVYFGTLAQRTPAGFAALQSLLAARPPGSRALCDLNLRPRCYGRETVVASLRQADVLKLNAEEFAEIKAMLGPGGSDESFTAFLFREFGLEMIALTRGEAGAELIRPNDRRSGAPPPVPQMADTVGAGDAFAALLALGLLRGWSPGRTLELALEFSSRICSVAGALPRERGLHDAMRARMAEEGHG